MVLVIHRQGSGSEGPASCAGRFHWLERRELKGGTWSASARQPSKRRGRSTSASRSSADAARLGWGTRALPPRRRATAFLELLPPSAPGRAGTTRSSSSSIGSATPDRPPARCPRQRLHSACRRPPRPSAPPSVRPRRPPARWMRPSIALWSASRISNTAGEAVDQRHGTRGSSDGPSTGCRGREVAR